MKRKAKMEKKKDIAEISEKPAVSSTVEMDTSQVSKA